MNVSDIQGFSSERSTSTDPQENKNTHTQGTHTCTHTEGEAEVLPLSAMEVQRIECQALSELLSPEVI